MKPKRSRFARRIVLKFGSGVLSRPGGKGLARDHFARIAAEIAPAVHAGFECVIVSSGAVAAGLRPLGLDAKPDTLAARQACAAVGQPRLMQAYETAFASHGITVAQLLLSHDDIDSRLRASNARNTLDHLFAARSVVPVINENDSVAVEELKFDSNDRLAAEVAILCGAHQLAILTTVDGLLDASGKLVREVRDPDAVASLVTDDVGPLATGGMGTKLEAARIATAAGIPTLIASGLKPGVIPAIFANKLPGTRFPLAD